MAVIVSDATFPVVVATIPESAEAGAAEARGKILVLNEVVNDSVPLPREREAYRMAPKRRFVTIRKVLLTKEQFKELYRVSGRRDGKNELDKFFFYEVERKKYKE